MLRAVQLSVVCVAVVTITATTVKAESYLFSGQADGGTAAAELDFVFSGNTATITIDNTSPTTLDSGSGENAPAIVGFGFSFLPASANLVNWSLIALDAELNSIQIGGTSGGTGDWKISLDDGFGGKSFKFDYLPETTGSLQGALYNPSAIDATALAAPPHYFTNASLTMTFDAIVDGLNPDTQNNPAVRMQNVGFNGNGSVKLSGILADDGGSPVVPEPTSLALLATGALGFIGYGWRRKRKLVA